LEPLFDDAVDWTGARLRRHSRIGLSPFAAKPWSGTSAELRLHLAFLLCAVESATSELFVEYVRWSAAMLMAKGRPMQSLSEPLALLQSFFGRRVAAAERGAVQTVLKAGLAAIGEAAAPPQPLFHAHLPPPLPGVDDMVARLLDADVVGARMLAADSARGGAGYVDIATGLVQPALYRIGRLWECNHITVADEHVASATAQSLLARLAADAPRAVPNERRALIACVDDNTHALGAMIVADAFAVAGWSVRYLNDDTPRKDLVRYVSTWRPELVGLSVSLVSQVPTLRQTVRSLRQTMGPLCPRIVVGGIALNELERVWRWIGADAWCPDAAQAVAEATGR
jgi:methanogenic corrinoid protein MtbC1